MTVSGRRYESCTFKNMKQSCGIYDKQTSKSKNPFRPSQHSQDWIGNHVVCVIVFVVSNVLIYLPNYVVHIYIYCIYIQIYIYIYIYLSIISIEYPCQYVGYPYTKCSILFEYNVLIPKTPLSLVTSFEWSSWRKTKGLLDISDA